MNFDEIVGQKEVVGSLKTALEKDRIGHAYVFNGPRGIGKKTVARIFASLLLCMEKNSGQRCGKCLPCKMFENDSNPDFQVIEPGDSSIGVEEIRKLQGDVVIRPMYSQWKVYLIAEADRMTAQAQNCLLKTLEEPPPYIVILLTASNYEALMETIRSRTIRYNFKRNSYPEVLSYLQFKYPSSLKGLEFIASYADGVIGNALELAESEEFMQLRERIVEILLKLEKSRLMDVFDSYGFFEGNKEYMDNVLDMMLLFYRDLLMAKKSGKENILINSDKKDIILGNAPRFSPRKLWSNIEAVEAARKNLKQNVNFQLAVEVMLMKLQDINA